MSIAQQDYEKLGQFYLGKEYDMEKQAVTDDLLLYDSKDLVTHGVVLGMTGSGKTGLCIALLEEAAMDNIPAIIIDPKGDIANLLLTFPELAPQDFRPWINEDDASKKGITPDELAAKTAAMWEKGLADWGQPKERIATLRDKVDINIFTPGSRAGIPVSILSSLSVPPFEVLDDGELLGDRVESTVSSLLSLVGVDADPIQSPEAVLLSTILQKAWLASQDLTLETLIRHIQKPSFDKVGILDLESFLPNKDRQALALKFNNLIASPGFSTWLEGPPLDIAKMLHTPEGKPRMSIFSIAHLGDAERMFFVSLLLNQMLGWMRAQKGTTSLRAMLYMDEIYGYLPPTANPPSKKPMMTMLKQARAFGLGCLFATQNPVDLDYKALSNTGTWFLGRLQTERDKMRVLDGLEGAAGSQNAKFDRSEMEKLISGLGNRIFLMNNVHDGAPQLMHVRWVMSYLVGPLARGQIKQLMDPKREQFEAAKPTTAKAAANPMEKVNVAFERPAIGSGVTELFMPVSGSTEDIIYKPHLFMEGYAYFSQLYRSKGRSHQVHTKIANAQFMQKDEDGEMVNLPNRIAKLNPITVDGFDTETELPPPTQAVQFQNSPSDGTKFGEVPGVAMNSTAYKELGKNFQEWIYRNYHTHVFYARELDEYSDIGESEASFRPRLIHEAREARDLAVEAIKLAIEKKIDTVQTRKRTEENKLAKEKAESSAAKMQAGVAVLGGLLGGLLGSKTKFRTSRRSTTTTIGKATAAYKQHQDVSNAEDRVEDYEEQIEELRNDLKEEIEKITRLYDPATMPLDKETLKPTRSGIKVKQVALLWLPYDERGERAW